MYDWKPWLLTLGALAGAALLALGAHLIVFSLAKRGARRTGKAIHDSLVRRGRAPLRALLPLLAVSATLPELPLPADVTEAVEHIVGLALIASTAWLVVALLHVVEDVLAAKYRIDTPDNLVARRLQTQIHMLRRITVGVVVVVAVSFMLMTFPSIRHLGVSLLASAGLAGIVAGMAARPALSNLIAGLQIAMTQPIRIDDVVVVEGEWGWIEEISTTYVVVRIWDLRRLVLPLSYFIEHPFQNWTRITADLLGTVFIYADYTVPVEEVRQELHRILSSTGMWDGKAWGLQVTNATDRVVELRALMSAPDSGTAWDLRCHVREKLVRFLQERYPEALPRARAVVDGIGSAGLPSR
jgi:hypothetical protein